MSCDIECGFRSAYSLTILSGQISSVKSLALVALLLPVGRCYRASVSADIHPVTETIEGIERDGQNPISGAVIRVQATEVSTFADYQGHFILTRPAPCKSVVLTARTSGYYVGGGQEYLPGTQDVEILLVPHATEDNPDYEWVSAFSEAGNGSNSTVFDH